MATFSGLSLSSENYKERIEILTNRYGNTQVLVSAHIDSLLKITEIKDLNDLEGLRKFYNDIESCVRNLKSLNIETTIFILFFRKFAGELWTFDTLLKYYIEELKAKKCCAKYLLKSGYDKNEHNKNIKYDPLNKNAQENYSHNYRITKTTLQHQVFQHKRKEQRTSQGLNCSENQKPAHCLKVTSLESRGGLYSVEIKFLDHDQCLEFQHHDQ